MSEHTAKITRITEDRRLHVLKEGNVSLLCASYHDALSKGYNSVRQQAGNPTPPPIEAHAYSTIETEHNQHLHHHFSHDNQDAYILTSVGHEKDTQRFPGTAKNTFGVAVLDSEAGIRGKTKLGLGNICFILRNLPYHTLDTQGRETTTKGTSPAVVILAMVAAILRDQLIAAGHPPNKLYLHAAMASHSIPYDNQLLFDVQQFYLRQLYFTHLKPGRSKQVRLRLRKGPFSPSRGFLKKNDTLSLVTSLDGRICRDNKFEIIDHRGGLPLRCQNQVAITWPPGPLHTGYTIEITGQFDEILICAQRDSVRCDLECSTPFLDATDQVIVGYSGSHDASACVMVNGKLRSAIQLERLTRNKHDGRSSLDNEAAIQYCLDSLGLSHRDVDCFAYNLQNLMPEYTGLSQPVVTKDFTLFDPFAPESVFVSHHLCHALAGYSGSGHAKGNVVVMDGSGGSTVGADDLILSGPDTLSYLEAGLSKGKPDLHTLSHYEISEDGFTLLNREYNASFNVRSGSNSLGEAYAAVSQFVFGSWQDSGKLMGLAPYGSPRFLSDISASFSSSDNNFSHQWKNQFTERSNNPLDHADLACSVQYALETATLDRLGAYNITNSLPLTFTGGVALNSVLNHKIRAQLQLNKDELFLLPAQHDAGVSIGAAVAADFKLNKRILNDAYEHDYLGKVYTLEEVAACLNRYSDRIAVRHIEVDDLAQGLHQGSIYGYFSLKKGSEFGPRALGARSILANPCKQETWPFINRWIKFREDFRPFAPMVCEEDLERFFEGQAPMKHMLEIVKVKEAYRVQLPAVTHVDGTARVQTVSAKDNAEIHELLKAFEQSSGVPILLNTSFNVRGQPIVESPHHAIEMLLCTHLDGVVFGDTLVTLPPTPTQVDSLWPCTSCVKLSPGATLEAIYKTGEEQPYLNSLYQNKRFPLKPDTLALLKGLMSPKTPEVTQTLLDQAGSTERANLHKLIKLKLVNLCTPL